MRKSIFLILFYCFSLMLSAQYNWDIGGFVGLANYLGEIGGDDKTSRKFLLDMKLSQTRWALGAFVRHKFSPIFSLNTGFGYARIQGADSLSSNAGRRGRNLSFRNDFFELSFKGEFYVIQPSEIGIRKRKHNKLFNLYGFAGIAGIYHNPKANYKQEWIELQPLQTENKAYSKIQMVIPLGAGCYFICNKQHRIGIEAGWRITFTDYLDDVSTIFAASENLNSPMAIALANRNVELDFNDPTIASMATEYTPGSIRGNPKNNDSYLFFEITYSYAIKDKPKFSHKKFSCS